MSKLLIKMIKKPVVLMLCTAMILTLVPNNEKVEAASKTKYICVEKGKTTTISKVTKKPKVSGKSITVSLKNKKLSIKGKSEGVSSFTLSGKKYKVIVTTNNLPVKHNKPEFMQYKSGVYCTAVKDRIDKYVTVYNDSNKTVDIVLTHSDYRDDKTLFESRDYTVNALKPKTSYTFFVYSCMPYSKDNIKVSNSQYKAVSSEDVEVTAENMDAEQYIKFNITNKTNEAFYVKISYIKYNKNGIAACGETKPIFLFENMSTIQSVGAGSCENTKVKIIGLNLYKK